MKLKIADFYVELSNKGEIFTRLCKDFMCEDAPHIDFATSVVEEDIAFEKQMAEEEVTVANCAANAFFRKFCAYALENNAFMMHGALVEYKGRGYLFTAHSGTGKTTHIRLWQQLFGEDKVVIVNGDKPIIRFIDGKVYAYGTPWNGKEHYGTNGRVELSAICFLERDKENSIKKIADFEALPRIFSQIMIHDSTNLAKQMELVDGLLEKVPTYILKCNMDVEAAKVAYEGMSEVSK